MVTQEQERSTAEIVSERLNDVLGLTELLKMAELSYKDASPESRRDLVIALVTELVVVGGNIAKIGARDAFKQLLDRPRDTPCGEGEIRTHGPPLADDSFQDCCLKPLGHLSIVSDKLSQPTPKIKDK